MARTQRKTSEVPHSDEAREAQIEGARLSMLKASTPDAKRYWWEWMRLLIAHRSATQVAHMERERGLA